MSDKAVIIGAIVVGFVLVPPLARANAALVNGFLFLILFASLLMHRDVWLPYLAQVSTASVSPTGGGPASNVIAPVRTVDAGTGSGNKKKG